MFPKTLKTLYNKAMTMTNKTSLINPTSMTTKTSLTSSSSLLHGMDYFHVLNSICPAHSITKGVEKKSFQTRSCMTLYIMHDIVTLPP